MKKALVKEQQFFSPRQDGVQEFYVDKPLLKEYRAVTEQNFSHADDEGEQQRVVALFGDEDTLVHTRPLFEQHYRQAVPFHGEHRMNDHSFMHSIVPVMRWIDDRQCGRSRPIIYIGIETLQDSRLKPTASSQKAVRQLVENYQLYFVAPAACLPRTHYAEVEEWLQQYVDTPAWNHTIFADQRHLLFGDYLIESAETKSPLATRIAFGSDTFKTWDDVLEFFSRLGGQ